MLKFLKKYKAFIYGLILFRIAVIILVYADAIKIDNQEYLANTLSFFFCWLLFSLPIHYFSFIKKHQTISFKFLVLLMLFSLIIINDANSNIIDNPITIIGLIITGISFLLIIVEDYIKKHLLITVVYYFFSIGYFLYIRVYLDDLDQYLQQEKEIKIILTLPFLVLIIGWILHHRNWLKSMESKKVKAELSLLKSQVNPHFFFNTLNNLYGLTVEKSDDAPDVVLKLSEMMRYTIYMGKEDVVPLKEEITFLQNYIDLHKLRYHENIDIQFETTLTKEYQIAPLLFIIALENAFKHGAEKLTKNAYIYLSMKDIEGCLEFTIENNFDKNHKETTPGIGLNNLKERLELLYPKKHQLSIDKFESVYKLSLKIDLS